MRFTVVFSGRESSDLSFGLCFVPCPVWYRGTDELLNLNPERPDLQPGAVARLRALPSLREQFANASRTAVVVVHPEGHGTPADQQTLLADLDREGFQVTVVRPAPATGRLSDAEAASIITAIRCDLATYESQYDFKKYPAAVIEELRRTFAEPESVSFSAVETALKWKYGHLGKQNYPGAQRQLAVRIADLWPSVGIHPGEDPRQAFERWQKLLPTSYITACFLLHLVNPREMPILDQHNYRCVNHLLSGAGRDVKAKKIPSGYGDLLLVRDFIAEARRNWTKVTGEPAIEADRLDRYLMMHGKALKPKRRN